MPDHFQRLETAIRWATEHAYKPVFYHEGFLGGADWDQAPPAKTVPTQTPKGAAT